MTRQPQDRSRSSRCFEDEGIIIQHDYKLGEASLLMQVHVLTIANFASIILSRLGNKAAEVPRGRYYGRSAHILQDRPVRDLVRLVSILDFSSLLVRLEKFPIAGEFP